MKNTSMLRAILVMVAVLTGLLTYQLNVVGRFTTGLPELTLLLVATSFFFIRKSDVQPEGAEQAATETELRFPETPGEASKETIDLVMHESHAKHKTAESGQALEKMEAYLHLFYDRYKSFYGDIQLITVNPTDEQSRNIRRQLVEMGLHALSFSRAVKFNKLDRDNDEPNVRLIIDQLHIDQLDKSTYRLYTDDPYQTEKRYHILRKVFQEMDLDYVNALTETVYIAPDYLTKP